MNRCMKTEFARLLGGLDWIAVDTKALTKSVKILSNDSSSVRDTC